MSLRSKWVAGKARGGRISKLIRNRRATQPPAHFHRNPLGRGQLAVFLRCSLLTYRSRYARRSRLEKQPTDLRRNSRDLGDGTLGPNTTCGSAVAEQHADTSFRSISTYHPPVDITGVFPWRNNPGQSAFRILVQSKPVDRFHRSESGCNLGVFIQMAETI